eukprot:TRINITY_DN10677_c0_g1_i1.p1 TRINITY_DN10677_c0_g1~~TRINITY_DN10677_c0_g1_i1.p1  ORF type:complete len:119 (-),score=21.31 TRINITY_DN10677_c0_g1_i1:92-448(-)
MNDLFSDVDVNQMLRRYSYDSEEQDEKEVEQAAQILQILKVEQPNSKKRKRVTPEQRSALEEFFYWESRPSLEIRMSLAKKLDMTPRRVQIWFQNKRQRSKKTVYIPRREPILTQRVE